jgi:hypothetical protein
MPIMHIPQPGAPPTQDHGSMRLRLGVGLFILSWLPIAQLVVWIGGLSGDDAGTVRLWIWGIQIVIGWIGLVLVGTIAAKVIKGVGWRRMPQTLWLMLRTGGVPAA